MSKKLEDFLVISGQPGLFELTARTRTGFMARSLTTGKTQTFGVRDQVSVLSEISIYTTTEEKPLGEILKKLHQTQEGKAVDKEIKDDKNKALALFEEILPDFDKSKVYHSDIKKVIQWYNQLLGVEDFSFEQKTSNSKEKSS